MLGVTIGPVAGRPESPGAGEEPAMTSPVFPVPLIPPQPCRTEPGTTGFAVPLPRGSLCADYDDGGTPLVVTVEDRDEVCVVHADGEVDIATAPLLGRALETGLAGGRPTVVVDLRQISFVDCTGIGLLTAARCRAHGQGTRLRILAGRAVARTAALLELTTALGLHEAG
jgi:anti-anti-sigma factor